MSRIVWGRKAIKLESPRRWGIIVEASMYACPSLSILIQGADFIPNIASQICIFVLNGWMIAAKVISIFMGVEAPSVMPEIPDAHSTPSGETHLGE